MDWILIDQPQQSTIKHYVHNYQRILYLYILVFQYKTYQLGHNYKLHIDLLPSSDKTGHDNVRSGHHMYFHDIQYNGHHGPSHDIVLRQSSSDLTGHYSHKLEGNET